MQSESLQAIKRPVSSFSKERLGKYGLALEYFEHFEQGQHDFHSHEFIEILYVIRGRFRHITAGQTYDESSGGLTILNFRQFHSLKTAEGSVELMNIYIDPNLTSLPDLPDPLSQKLYDLIPIHQGLENRLNGVIHMSVKDPDKMTVLLKMLLMEQESEGWGSETALQTLYKLFLIELCRAAPVIEKDDHVYRFRMEAVYVVYLEKHYTESVRLDDLCEISGLNSANLCRRFKEYTGKSTGDFSKQRRLAAALQRLRSGNDKILTVAEDCGFSDVSRFNRFFRDAFSCSPSEYRRRFNR
ncbi:AraC family transcriptional regulator [Oceanispirochaeta sp.]|jgi:AraC-like DNA-binding protein/quercetin dioxygenase-like cupin family protein|uniref:AraC family transcriptional regulator n=1 Tax=Oceanispirochaeta sp. TaxID=2035350 RepID=UPI00262C5D68|nr:AraC family transcriptional regulator [Oceanispirochaeta sp.]MDA3956830.1 AraC family transcriptional regulator [Oceanispirochaeta sp.]